MNGVQHIDSADITRWLWSAFYFSATFILLHYTAQFWSAFNAWKIGYTPHFSYDGMENLFYTTGWNPKRIAFVYLASPLWGLVCNMVGFVGFTKTATGRTHLKVFWFWLSFNGFLLYFSYIVTGLLSGVEYSSDFFTGFVGFYSWLNWKTIKIIGILFTQAAITITLCLMFPPMIIKLNHSRKILSGPTGRWRVLLHVFFIPFILGCVFVLFSTYPMALKYQLVRFVSCLPILGVFLLVFKYVEYKRLTIVKGGIDNRPHWQLAIAMSILFVLSKFFLGIELTPVIQ